MAEEIFLEGERKEEDVIFGSHENNFPEWIFLFSVVQKAEVVAASSCMTLWKKMQTLSLRHIFSSGNLVCHSRQQHRFHSKFCMPKNVYTIQLLLQHSNAVIVITIIYTIICARILEAAVIPFTNALCGSCISQWPGFGQISPSKHVYIF